jgi:dTDP-4-amino-4,6-dideoxygalactose transaminase
MAGQGLDMRSAKQLAPRLRSEIQLMTNSESTASHIPFNRFYTTGEELDSIADAIRRGHISADGRFSAQCRSWLEDTLGCHQALVVHSCTAALELSALLLDVGPGDEVIMPSYTFVTTATAFVLRGATPVFVDICADTLNLDVTRVEAAMTKRTRAIVPVHYAGVACEMGTLLQVAGTASIPIIEDAAQGVCASYEGRPLGTLGTLGALSFHETKNVTCGHGGVLLVNDEQMTERAEVLRDKGTNRSSFVRGQVDKYTWLDVGSSYAISDLAAAFLWPQLQESAGITDSRLKLWEAYYERFGPAEEAGLLCRPVVPDNCQHNAHMFYVTLPSGGKQVRGASVRDRVIKELKGLGIDAVFHYVPLHSSPGGRRYGRTHGTLQVTDEISRRLIRLPLWNGMTLDMIDRVVAAVTDVLIPSRKSVAVRAI